jgi:two-component system CheB/CheR fusion protein
MILSEGRLLLTDKDPLQSVALPIDRFFRSLAQDAGECAIGVILSGTGSDGSRGIRDIHDAGGLVVVQSPDSAKFDGMPNSAIRTGAVHVEGRPEDIPNILLRHIKSPLQARHEVARPIGESIPVEGMGLIVQRLREVYGIDFSHYKTETVTRRTERRLSLSRVTDINEYARRLETDPHELNLLYRDLLIGVTEFFRDEEAFSSLETQVLPDLILRVPPDEEFRVWVAGCATGEETYSLAITILEAAEKVDRRLSLKIFSTDVHRTSLDFASAGIYPRESLEQVDKRVLSKYFVPLDNHYQVVPEVRRMIVFAHHNVLKDAPFTKLDLITCRNLLIYFQPTAQRKVLSLFHFGLKTGGGAVSRAERERGRVGRRTGRARHALEDLSQAARRAVSE